MKRHPAREGGAGGELRMQGNFVCICGQGFPGPREAPIARAGSRVTRAIRPVLSCGSPHCQDVELPLCAHGFKHHAEPSQLAGLEAPQPAQCLDDRWAGTHFLAALQTGVVVDAHDALKRIKADAAQ